MIAQIVPALPLPRSMGLFDYDVPDGLTVIPGQIVGIPFRGRSIHGIVWATPNESSIPAHRRRPILSIEQDQPQLNEADRSFADWIAERYGISLGLLVKTYLQRPWPSADERPQHRYSTPLLINNTIHLQPKKIYVGIFSKQRDRIAFYRQLFAKPGQQPILIIVPELSGLRDIAPILPAGSAVIFSEQSKHERLNTAAQIVTAPVIVGTRSLLLFPLPAIRLCVLDDEDNDQHKQRDQQPRISSLMLAQELVKRRGIPLLALSVAPTVTAFASAGSDGNFSLGNDRGPQIQLLERTGANNGTRELQRLLETLHREHKRIFVFLNRRGFARLLVCPDCGWTARCPKCDTTLVREESDLRCPTDGSRSSLPDRCPQCQNPSLLSRFPGTAGLERIIERLWPGSVARIDHDQPKDEFQNKTILIGTELAIPYLTQFNPEHALVSNIDAVFSQPSARALERAFQLLRRIGATDSLKTMTIETRFPKSHLFQSLAQNDVTSFLTQELETRQRYGLPPAQPLIAFDTRQHAETALPSLRAWLGNAKADTAKLRGPITIRQGRQSISRFLFPQTHGWTIPVGSLTSLPESWIIDPDPQL